MSKRIYLGVVCPDTRKEGIDSLKEVQCICDAILDDYKKGRISKKTASGRIARMHNTVIPKLKTLNKKQKEKAKKIMKKCWERLRELG